MYPVSADFHNLSIADAPTSRVRIYFIEANVDCTDDNDVQSNGTLLCIPGETDSNGRIEKGGVTINEFFNSDANVRIGATVSSQIGMTLINRDGALDGFNYGRCKVYIDVYDDTNSTWLTCPMGVYNIAIPKRRKVQLVSATGYDQMQQLDEIADSWWNGLDWSNGITMLQIIQSMAATLGIHLSANTSANIVNSGLSYTEIPFTAIEMTYRDILSYIAETTGTIARFDRNGALDLRWFSDAVLSTDTQTYAGGLVTFTATDRASISSLSVPFSPIQSGSGNPSPNNVRPISGLTGLSVYVSPTTAQADATTYAVDWTSEAGTVYGGTLDVVTGVLTVDKAYADLGTASWTKRNTSKGHWRFTTQDFPCVIADSTSTVFDCVCSQYVKLSPSSTYAGNTGLSNNTSISQVCVCDERYSDKDTFTTAMSGVQLAYPLATPITYQLSATQVAALAGTNNVWSTGDSVSVTVAEPTLVEIQTDTVGNQCLSIDVGEYQVSQIDALSVKASQADVGVTIGYGGNAYTILDNPMLFGDEAAITTKATPIYNRLSAFRLFTPISMRCIMDWSIEAGDIITVTNESVTYDLPIFQQRLRWRGGYVVSDLFSNGEQERPTQSKEIRSSFRSNTQMHEFEVTLEQLRSYIQSVDGNYTLIQQTVDAIAQTVANQNVTIQNILDPTGEIWTAITKNTSNLSSIEDSLNNEITERRSYIRFIPSEPAIVMGVDEDNEIKLKLVNNIIYFFNGADDSTDLSLAYAYFNSQEAFADRFVAGESVQIGTNDNTVHWLWKKLNNGDLVLELVG